LSAHARLSGHAATLRFLIVQPPSWDADDWPAWTRRLIACAMAPPAHFVAALVWTLPGAVRCPASRPATTENPPRATR
jgi:hypothetical protein